MNPLLAALLEPSLEKRLVEHSVSKGERERERVNSETSETLWGHQKCPLLRGVPYSKGGSLIVKGGRRPNREVSFMEGTLGVSLERSVVM